MTEVYLDESRGDVWTQIYHNMPANPDISDAHRALRRLREAYNAEQRQRSAAELVRLAEKAHLGTLALIAANTPEYQTGGKEL